MTRTILYRGTVYRLADNARKLIPDVQNPWTKFYMDVQADEFVHFTLANSAKNIVAAHELRWMNSKYALDEGIFAVSLTYGKPYAVTQRNMLYWSDDRGSGNPVVAVRFKTNDRPVYADSTEVRWRIDKPVVIYDTDIVSEAAADALLSKSPETISRNARVYYAV